MNKEQLFDMTNTYTIIPSKELDEKMETLIVPYLESRSTTFELKGKDQNVIVGTLYRADEAKGSVLISHGFTESQLKYRELIYYFLNQGYNVCIHDHRNHGHSRNEPDKGPTHIDRFQDYVDDLDVVVKRAFMRFPRPYYLYCHSMGGLIGTSYLLQNSNIFEKAVLSSPLLEVNRGNLSLPVAKMLASTLCLIGRGKKFLPGQGTFNPKEDFENSASTCFERYIQYYRCQMKDPFLQSSGSSCRWASQVFKTCDKVLANCKNINIPVLLFQADRDDFVLPGGQEKFIDSLYNGRLIFVKDAKHEIYLSDDATMELYVQSIFDFYK